MGFFKKKDSPSGSLRISKGLFEKSDSQSGSLEQKVEKGQPQKQSNVVNTLSGVGKLAMTGLYAGVFVWLFMPMCEMQNMDRLYPGYNIPKIEQVKKKEKKVALIPISGAISSDANAGANSNAIVSYIDDAVQSGVAGFIFEIDSPGGVVLPSKDMMERIKRLDQPKIALIRNIGASGAYWVASACDYIIADETSMVGSIGVRMDRFDVSELMRKLGVKYDPVYAGAHKTMGSPFNELSQDERKILKNMVDDLHELFIASVAENRKMKVDNLRPLADGRVFLGQDAVNYSLIDLLGGRADAAEWMYGRLNAPYDLDLYKQSQQKGLFGITSSIGRAVGEGIGQVILEYTIKRP